MTQAPDFDQLFRIMRRWRPAEFARVSGFPRHNVYKLFAMEPIPEEYLDAWDQAAYRLDVERCVTEARAALAQLPEEIPWNVRADLSEAIEMLDKARPPRDQGVGTG